MTYNEKQLKQAIELAFKEGDKWARTYHGWFTPTKKDNKDRLKVITDKVIKAVKDA